MFDFESDWQYASTLLASQEAIETCVFSLNPGGVIVKFGRLKAFVPKAQLSRFHRVMFDESIATGGHEPSSLGQIVAHRETGRLDFDWTATTIRACVTEVDRARNRVLLSESAAAIHPPESSSA